MHNRSNLRFLALALLGVPYAIVLTLVLEPLVIADRLHVVLALLATTTPTVVGAFGALLVTPRR